MSGWCWRCLRLRQEFKGYVGCVCVVTDYGCGWTGSTLFSRQPCRNVLSIRLWFCRRLWYIGRDFDDSNEAVICDDCTFVNCFVKVCRKEYHFKFWQPLHSMMSFFFLNCIGFCIGGTKVTVGKSDGGSANQGHKLHVSTQPWSFTKNKWQFH